MRRNSNKALYRPLLAAYVIAGSLWLALIMLSRQTGIPFDYFVKDPFGIMKAPSYVGFFSNVGVFMWCASTTLCLATAAFRGRIPDEMSAYLFGAGLLSLLLMLDDFFMLHERFVPLVLHGPEYALSIPEILYCLAWLLWYRRLILKTEYPLLLLALVLFAVSFTIDSIHGHVPHRRSFEDGSKFFGILTWAIYFARLCHKELKDRLPAPA